MGKQVTKKQFEFFIETMNTLFNEPSGGKQVGQLGYSYQTQKIKGGQSFAVVELMYIEHNKRCLIYRRTFSTDRFNKAFEVFIFTRAYYEVLTHFLCAEDGQYKDTNNETIHVISFKTLMRDGLKNVK